MTSMSRGTATFHVAMTQCCPGSLLQAKSCSTHVFWVERVLVYSHVEIISDTQITLLDHSNGCHMGSCPHLGSSVLLVVDLPADRLCGELGWLRQQVDSAIASAVQSSSREGLFFVPIFFYFG